VLAFGAVAAVVFAGISISGFGNVDPDTAPAQFRFAVGGAAAAPLGVLGALLVAMPLAAASTVSAADLRRARPRRAIRKEAAIARRASSRLSSLTRKQTTILEAASYLRLRRRFAFARWWILILLAVAAAGATTFLWATGSAATESVPERASPARWTVPADDREVLRRQLGAQCVYDFDDVPVTILGEQGDKAEADIVTTPSLSCRPVRLVVETRQLVRDS
jgi:hypothetical protein